MNIRKGYCDGCPFDYGQEATEIAYNLGCLPSTQDVMKDCADSGKAWACHSESEKVCCGFAATDPKSINLPLLHVQGIHS